MSVRWCDWRGDPQNVATPMPSPVLLSQCLAKASAKDVLFRDLESFVAGEIHSHVGEWEKIVGSYSKQQEVLHYIRQKINVKEFFFPFRGDFQGSCYNTATPPKMVSNLFISLASDLSDLFLTPEIVPFTFGEGLAWLTLLISLCQSQLNHLIKE